MIPAPMAWTMYQGDSWAYSFRMFNSMWDADANDGAGGWVKDPDNPFNLDGYTGRCQVRRKASDDTVLAEVLVSWGPQSGDTEGVVLCSLPDGRTAHLPVSPPSGWIFDFELTDGADQTETYLRGPVRVMEQVTR